ncbi:MAG TPA: hypothetical protein VM934_10420 [Pyrinomonadaceae bacterium]|nr:hypothetical protein [Pyrinomonadaceae bacterium]
MKKVFEVVGWLTAIAILAFAGRAVFAGALPGASARALAAVAQQEQNRARRASESEETNPPAIMRAARTIFIRPTTHLDKKYLEYKLQKYRELDDWDLMIVTEERAADLVLQVDKTALNYIFTITDPRSSIVVMSGKTVAINGLVAAENLGREIIKKIKDVRASSERRPKKKKSRDGDDEDEWSES